MTAPNASPEAAASFGAVIDDKLATDIYDTEISSAGAVPSTTELGQIHGQHKAEELLYALDRAMPAESDTQDVAAHAMRAAGTTLESCTAWQFSLPRLLRTQPNDVPLSRFAFDDFLFTLLRRGHALFSTHHVDLIHVVQPQLVRFP